MGIALVTLSIIFGLIISYLIGNILFAQVIAKFYYKKNIRDQGSRNPGATNLVRITKNRYVGVVASFLDAAKGYVCVVIATFTIGLLLKKYNMEELSPFIFLCGTFAILGHCFPIFYCVKLFKGVKGEELKKYSGGKGVSTFGGTVFAVAPYLGLLALGV
jgi:glycerol-3-phosphate acyltransferase PlsY